jgi:hypothetical protein
LIPKRRIIVWAPSGAIATTGDSTMLPYGIETCLNRLIYPKGGVAPLRHELMAHDYIERQRQWNEQRW